ncbi:hypothetical protein SETIT_3G235200v2 [Setaria italica]|uniref:Uncharacterized protein n=1 Tax=Setaria italica TaxID=4555 RepID=K3Z9Z5_SETIT|nr:uncharacterized protein LOC101781451 [Setaria italica]XP_004962018.1 uncharacterized protein LOC101781451 [Setaria italica]XP_022680639.1 uncharacterized protein LOC101781451 [Setaria italica]XP_022680640.1 uncharacterized protein LOC101781451 [Setaria italica]RCV17624.1 hypothetical protein SETIT_3G235200v2 [Setaria italica]RCV17625.1 hypothetical protein SETIT_3G235200v2 [Setaria italica]RCV17626.1 hypothetical protein SETIT_3G235200v2 [Setaria italica]RCV17627.1 hypothetical protein SE
MSSFAGQRSRPWVGMAGVGTPSEPAGDSVAARDDAAAASSMRGGADASTNASAISFGFAATAVLVSMFLLMAIFEHLIKPGLASSSSSSSSSSPRSDDDSGEGRGGRRRMGLPPARLHHQHDASPDKVGHSPKVDEDPVAAAPDLTVLMPGHRYPTFLAQPAPLAPCPREGVRWPPHEHLRSFLPP